MTGWRLISRDIDAVIETDDLDIAFNALSNIPLEHFGLIVTGQNAAGDVIAIRTSELLFRWRRDDDACLVLHLAMMAGLPYTKEKDWENAGRNIN